MVAPDDRWVSGKALKSTYLDKPPARRPSGFADIDSKHRTNSQTVDGTTDAILVASLSSNSFGLSQFPMTRNMSMIPYPRLVMRFTCTYYQL